ncbi:hypothetical protein [Xanthomonas medicagonis]|uniref:hypothetical protein n=1 Tax=Xanthomonas medicagonis TaxID=3160841 RepID=UPI003513BD6C
MKVFFDRHAALLEKALNCKLPEADAFWLRCAAHGDGEIVDWTTANIGSISFYAMLIDDDFYSDGKNEKLKDFLGAFGKNNMLQLNREKAIGLKGELKESNLYLDVCELASSDAHDIKKFLGRIFNSKLGFLVASRNPIGVDDIASISRAILKETNLNDVLGGIKEYGDVFFGLAMESDEVTRSLVFLGKRGLLQELPALQDDYPNEDFSSIEESIAVFGDRFAGRSEFSRLYASGDL